MPKHNSARRVPADLRRNVLGLLAIVWLNMAVLPCAMAFQGDDDCPHCPPVEEQAPHHGMAGHDGHSQEATKEACSTAQTDCCDEIAANIDGRGSKLEQRPVFDVAFAGPSQPDNGAAPGRLDNRRATDPPDIIGCSPPLRTLYCVYLK